VRGYYANCGSAQWSEVLEVLVSLGYRKVAEAAPLPGLPVKIENKDQV